MNRSTIALVWVLSLLAAVGLGWWLGYDVEKTKCVADQVKPLVKSIERHDEAAVAGNIIERGAVRAEARQESFTKRLTQEVRRAPIAMAMSGCDDGLDAFRMYRWRAANRGAPIDAASEFDGIATGGAAAAGEQLQSGPDREPHRDGGDVPPPAREIQGAGELAGANE